MEEDKQLTIIEEPTTVAEIQTTDLDQVSEEQLIALLGKREMIRKVAIEHSLESHWESFDGENARLNRKGAEYLAQLFGVSFQIIEKNKMIERDESGELNGHYQYNVLVRAIMNHRAFDYLGCCDTHNSFLSWRGYGDNRRRLKPHEIDETNVLRKATANGIANAIGRLLNLSTIPIAALVTMSDKIKQIKYAGRKK